ncbi:MAG: pilus assembly protein [Propionibacteriaceae bacterium]|nr:pilus assembly protein [Propionibacteriaceae bacterium]
MTRDTRHRRAGERGSVSIQMTLLLPVMFSILFLGMQAALYHHARSVATAAAQEGARAAAADGARASDGCAAARSFVERAHGALEQPSVACTRTLTSATVTVTGASVTVIAGWRPEISHQVSSPVERIT